MLFPFCCASLVPVVIEWSALPAFTSGLSVFVSMPFRIPAFGAFCTLYAIGFVADVFLRVEKGQRPSGTDSIIYFLLALPLRLPFVGMWLFRPKLNRLCTGYERSKSQGENWSGAADPTP